MMIRIENIKDELHVYISGMMTDETCDEINDSIKLGIVAGIKNVVMHINSYGGSVKGAWDIISTIKSNNLNLVAINEGFAISAASILLASANESKAFDYSTSMIHDPSLGNTTLEKAQGSAKELLTAIKDGIMTILNNRLKLPIEKLSNFLTKETSWNAQEQLQFGLVDSIITTANKPVITDSMDLMMIWNTIETHNLKQIKNENIMTQEEIDLIVKENEELKAKIAELEANAEIEKEIEVTPIEEVVPTEPTKEDEPVVPTEPVAPVEEACSPEEMKMKNELVTLKTENFILKNGLSNKSEMIENAVTLHGVEVLNTILHFINNDAKALETKVVELQNVITNKVVEANKALDGIITNTGVTNYEAMAEEIFGIKGDSGKRLEMKNENPELHEKLFNIYYNL